MRPMICALALLAALVGTAPSAWAQGSSVDLELVLLADVSGSIDDGEILFQRRGYATAINHPEVLWAISQGYEQRIAVTYVEWGTVGSQDVVVPWTMDSAAAFADALMAASRRAFGRNAMGRPWPSARR